MRSKRHSFLTNFLKLTGSFGINLYSLNMKFHEKIFTTIIIIQLWNFGNFGISEIIPKSLVTLRFSKISLHELKISCKTFQMRHWPNFYFDPAYSNTWLTCNAMRFKTNAHDCTSFGSTTPIDQLYCWLLVVPYSWKRCSNCIC